MLVFKSEWLAEMVQIQAALTGAGRDLTAVLDLAVALTERHLGAAGAVAWWSCDGKVTALAASGRASGQLGQARPDDDLITGGCLRRDEVVRLADGSILLPLHCSGICTGVLTLLAAQPEQFDRLSDGMIALLGGLIDTAISRAAEFEEGEAVVSALIESERRFSFGFENAPIGMALAYPDGRFLRVNQALCTMLGRPEGDFERITVTEITHPLDRGDVEGTLDAMMSGRLPSFNREKRYLRADGSVVWAVLSSTAVTDVDGKVQYLFSQIQDITERRQAEGRARQAAGRAEVLAEVSQAFAEAGAKYGGVLDVICRLGTGLTGATWGVVLLEENGEQGSIGPSRETDARATLELAALSQTDANLSQRLKAAFPENRVPLSGTLIGDVIRDGRARRFGPADFASMGGAPEAVAFIKHIGLSSLQAVPLLVRGRTIGALLVGSHEGRTAAVAPPDPDAGTDLSFLGELAERAAVAIDNARLLGAVRAELVERRRAERAVRDSEARFRAMVQNASDIITVLEPDGLIRYSSPAAERMLGFADGSTVGQQLTELVHPADRERVDGELGLRLQQSGVSDSFVYRIMCADRSSRLVESIVNNLLDDPIVAGLVVNTRDITDRERAQDELAHAATHDPLTDLPNRTLFLDRLEVALRGCRRPTTGVAVLFLDVDRFKLVNDSMGHAVGDELLVAVGERLAAAVRPQDTVARFGGDEFTVLADGINTVAAAEELAARLRLELAAPFLVQDSEFYLAASVGIAVGGTHTAAAELLRDADAAMYRAKDRGRARQEVFDTGMRAEAVARLDTEAALRRALGHGQLCLEFQPVVDLASGRIGAMEALVRWRHPTRGLVPPGDFIPLAEESGLILPLGAEVLEMACRQAAAWAAGPGAPLKVAVNLSPRQLADPDLVPMVASHLRASKLDPSLLCLEITESSLMETVENPREILDQLRTLGVTLVIDDFGTGYSSLSRLRRFPVATLKIDRSFVAELGCDPKGLDVVAAMVNLGHALDMEVVAEGIETQAQLQHLRELGCDGGQGFFLARPAPAEAVTTLLSGPPFRVGLTP